MGRHPAYQLMRRMPIPVRIAPFLPRGCPQGIYAGLARVSPGCPPDRGRLHTCYSPVRRSPAGGASTPSAAPRLACVKPAASVHPEPGSNSPLLSLYFLFSVCLFRPILVSSSLLTGKTIFPCINAACPVAPFHCSHPNWGLPRFGSAKLL